jgi:transcriptional regulator with XRE-family HTH domain
VPRPNQPRSIAGEQALARRVAYERDRRGMSYEGLASRMTKAGCPIQASGIYKIEKADPPRRITVDELVGFAHVFGIPVERLLLPPELVAADELADLVVSWDRAQDATIRAMQDEDDAWERLRLWVDDHPEFTEHVEAVFRHWSETRFEGDHEFRVARRMWALTKDEEWATRLRKSIDSLAEEAF